MIDRVGETERSVIAAIIAGEMEIDSVIRELNVTDFSTETNRLIFGAMKSLHEKREPIDVLNLCTELDRHEAPDGGAWSLKITHLCQAALPIGDPKFYSEKIRAASDLRQTAEAAYRLYELANKGDFVQVEKCKRELTQYTRRQSRLKPISATDLPDVESPETLWGGLLYPGAITQLSAEPGAGKSTFAYNIAVHGALGKPYLGLPTSKIVKTLYADLETPQWLRRAKIEGILGELPKGFYILDDLTLAEDFHDIVSLFNEEHYDLIIFDTQSRVLGMQDENSNAEANEKAILLTRLATETRAAILLIHHTKKGDGGKGVYRGRGASAIAAAVDIVATLNVLDADTLRLQVEKSRVPGLFDAVTMRKIGGDKFERISAEETNGGLEIERIQSFLLRLLSGGGEWRTAEIQEQAADEGYKERTVRDALRRLNQSGKVVKIRQGCYGLAGTILQGDKMDDFGIPSEFL